MRRTRLQGTEQGGAMAPEVGRVRPRRELASRSLPNTCRASNAPRAGRAALVAVLALALALAGVLWWIGSSAPSAGRGTALPAVPGSEPSGTRPVEELDGEIVPAEGVGAAPAGEGADELEPFTPARVADARFAGKTGSLRGHVEVTGEDPFPLSWKLVLKPSRTLPERERAESRTLEFEDGRQEFEVDDLPLGGYDVAAQAAGYNGQVMPILLEPGSEHPFVNLRMVPAGRLEGHILDADGVPAEGIPVTLFPVPEGAELSTVTNAHGVYRFETLPDGNYELLVGRPTAPVLPERRPLRFQAPTMTFPDIDLPVMGAIRVRAVNSLGNALEGVVVRGSGTNGGAFEGKTDYTGIYLAKHLPAGHFRLRLELESLGPQYERRVAVDVVAGQTADAGVSLGP